MKKLKYISSPIGKLAIIEDGAGICEILFESQLPTDISEGESTLLKNAAKQLEEYFDGKRKSFDLPLSLGGTDFQKSVWNELIKIPYGETRSYGEIAACVGNAKACRAVGLANNRNRIPIIIPCHRVVGASGKLTGYAGGLSAKETLLKLEMQGK